MGRRDNELTSDQEARADQLLRELLATYGEPQQAQPSPSLARRIVATLPSDVGVAPPRRVIGPRIGVTLAGTLILTLLCLGVWGVLGNSDGPASLLGGANSGLGRGALVLTLAAKPLVGSLGALGLPTIALGTLLATLAAGAWWLLVQRPLTVDPEALL